MGSCLIQKTSVLRKPFYVPFITSVDKDRSIADLGASPERIIYQIPLLESVIAFGIVIEMIKDLGEVFGSVKLVLTSSK